jgi:hypothetical protein
MTTDELTTARLDAPVSEVTTPLERLRRSLPLTDPDRHDLDFVADDLFAHLAPGYPEAGVAL